MEQVLQALILLHMFNIHLRCAVTLNLCKVYLNFKCFCADDIWIIIAFLFVFGWFTVHAHLGLS